MIKSENPIATRSKEMLVQALLSLMKEKKFHEISIAELTQKATLSRRTFYRLFTTKDEILLYHINQLWDKVSEKLYAATDNSYFHTSYFVMMFWYNNKDVGLLLYKNDLLSILQRFTDDISKKIYANNKATSPLSKNEEALEYALAYSSGGSINVIWKWFSKEMTKTPEELMELLMLSYKK